MTLFFFTFVYNDDSLDWKNYGRENIINTVVNHKHLGNGSIILCHNGAKYTAQALDDMIKGLKEKGYEIVPISKLIYKKNYQMDHEGRQFVIGEEGKVTQQAWLFSIFIIKKIEFLRYLWYYKNIVSE